MKRTVGAVLVLALLAAAAWGTWTYAIPHIATVPRVVGDPVDEVVRRLTGLGFEVEVARARFDQAQDVPADHVLLVRPTAGTELEVGGTVTIVPSRGPPPVQVPPVEGKPLEEARRLLERAGLEVSAVRERFDGRVRAGAVIARRPGDAHLPMGSAVTLVVSKGPAPVPIPDVSGMAEDKAVAKLDADGFEVLVEQTFSARVDRGSAIGTDPRAGTEVQPGEQVVLTVSLGPERFPCPEFVGLSVVEARALAEQYGLELAPLPVPGSNGDQVISQLPSAGTTVRYGSTVTVYHA